RNLRLSEYMTRARQTLEAATPATRWCNKSKNTRENDHGNARETNTRGIERDGQAHSQIALGGTRRESSGVVVSAHCSAKDLNRHPLSAICLIVISRSTVDRANRSSRVTTTTSRDPKLSGGFEADARVSTSGQTLESQLEELGMSGLSG